MSGTVHIENASHRISSSITHLLKATAISFILSLYRKDDMVESCHGISCPSPRNATSSHMTTRSCKEVLEMS